MRDLPEFLERDEHGEVRLKGHRIGLYHVAFHAERGASVERIVEEFPTLEPELVGRVLDYWRANRREVDAYVARCQVEIDRRRAAYSGPTLDDLRARVGQGLANRP